MRKFTKEHLKKLRISHLGNRQSPESRKKISRTMKGVKKSEETKAKMHAYHTSSKSHLWKGGVTVLHRGMRMSYEYRLWRIAVFQRDRFTCVFCGFKSRGRKPSDIHADHIKSFAYYPELRFAIDNGRTLCIPCHKITENFGKYG